ncbi:MAG: aldehyde dehydrogenase (NADP(+)) [Flavobacteriales bacterium]|nr:aldehyde dehydrogenase (NADP(+)) [Flavobacteriales bacterium]
MSITGKNYIGSTLSATGSKTFHSINPSTNEETSWSFFEASEKEVNAAIDRATQAFRTYRRTSDAERAAFLEQIAEEILALGDELIEVYQQESGLPQGRAVGERGRTVGQLKAFATMLRNGSWKHTSIDQAEPDRTPLPKADIRKTYIPVGPVAVFGASNFPLAFSTAGGDTASALAAGCPVVVKSHPAHAGVGELVASAIIKAATACNMPDGVFSHLNSVSHEVGGLLVKHEGIKAVGFTGSTQGGTALMKLANDRKTPIPVFAEMGSINPVILGANAVAHKGDQWAEQLANSINLGVGQFCTNPGLIIGLKGQDLDNFSSSLADKLGALPSAVMLSQGIQTAYESNKSAVCQSAGVHALVDNSEGGQALAKVDGAAFIANPQLHHEVFGPFSLIVECENEGERLDVIRSLEGQLTGTIIAEGDEMKGMEDVVDELSQKVGRILFNSVPTGVEVCASMHHGGPFPSTSNAHFTSVGLDAAQRWIRPLTYQNFPSDFLPNELRDDQG